MNDYSYILKVKHKDKYYICNRNSVWYNNLIKPSRIINFWGIEYDDIFQISENFKIVKVLQCSNINCKDQKYINEIKRELSAEDPELSEDDKICDIVISSTIQKYKSEMRKYKNRILTPLDECKPEELAYFIRFIKNSTYMSQFYKQKRYTFPSFDKWKEKANICFKKSGFAEKMYAVWLLFWGIGTSGDDKDQGIKTIKESLSDIFHKSSDYRNYLNVKAVERIKKAKLEEEREEEERKKRIERDNLERIRLRQERLEKENIKATPTYQQLALKFDKEDFFW